MISDSWNWMEWLPPINLYNADALYWRGFNQPRKAKVIKKHVPKQYPSRVPGAILDSRRKHG